MRKLCLILLAILLTSCGEKRIADKERFVLKWYDSIEEARQISEAEKRPMLLSFEVAWCPWCKVLRESLYANPSVIDSLKEFVCVMIDSDRQKSIAADYGVSVFPTIVVTDSYGNELTRLIGLYSAEIFLKRLNQAKGNSDVLTEMYMQEPSNEQDPVFQLTFGKALAELGIYDGAILRFEKAAQIARTGGTGVLEEATFSIAEVLMLKGDYKRAADAFRHFAISFPNDQRAETALILAARCYEEAGNFKASLQTYREYLSKYINGTYVLYASMKARTLAGGTSSSR